MATTFVYAVLESTFGPDFGGKISRARYASKYIELIHILHIEASFALQGNRTQKISEPASSHEAIAHLLVGAPRSACCLLVLFNFSNLIGSFFDGSCILKIVSVASLWEDHQLVALLVPGPSRSRAFSHERAHQFPKLANFTHEFHLDVNFPSNFAGLVTVSYHYLNFSHSHH